MKVSFSIAMFFKAPIGELGPSHLGHTGQQVPMLACLSSNSPLTGIHLVCMWVLRAQTWVLMLE